MKNEPRSHHTKGEVVLVIVTVVLSIVAFGLAGYFAVVSSRPLTLIATGSLSNRPDALPTITTPPLGTNALENPPLSAGSVATASWMVDTDTATTVSYDLFPSTGAPVREQALAHKLDVEDIHSEGPVAVGGQSGWQVVRSVDYVTIHSYTVVGTYLVDVTIKQPIVARHYAAYAHVLKNIVFSGTTTDQSLNATSEKAVRYLGIDVGKDWKTHSDSLHGFTFKYPPSAKIVSRKSTDPVNLVVSVSGDRTNFAVYFKTTEAENPDTPHHSVAGNGKTFLITKEGGNNPIASTMTFADDPDYSVVADVQPTNANVNVNATVNSNVNRTVNVNASNSTACVADADCGLRVCTGCFSKVYLKTAPPDLACREYEGYNCVCRQKKCTPVKDDLLTYQVDDAIAKASTLDDTRLCLSGTYQVSFEFSAIYAPQKTGGSSPTYVWIEQQVDERTLECAQTPEGEKSCSGQKTLCGTFRYAAPGEPGFGHVAAYRYMLE